MKLHTSLVACATLAVVPAFADGTFLVKYMSNLAIGDSVINISNTGASWGQNISTGGGAVLSNGNICANVYVFSPDEQLQACCSCFLTPNALTSFSRISLVENTLTGAFPSSIVIKLLASVACTVDNNPSSQTFGQCLSSNVCNAGTVGQVGQPLAGGLVAWGTTLHANTSTSPVTYQVTETPFDKASLSAKELTRITNLCANIEQNGSGNGICKGCPLEGL